MNLEETKTALKEQLALHGVSFVKEEGKQIFLELAYTIEVENPKLFKLLHAQQVVAPFDDIKELCEFIQMDKQFTAQ